VLPGNDTLAISSPNGVNNGTVFGADFADPGVGNFVAGNDTIFVDGSTRNVSVSGDFYNAEGSNIDCGDDVFTGSGNFLYLDGETAGPGSIVTCGNDSFVQTVNQTDFSVWIYGDVSGVAASTLYGGDDVATGLVGSFTSMVFVGEGHSISSGAIAYCGDDVATGTNYDGGLYSDYLYGDFLGISASAVVYGGDDILSGLGGIDRIRGDAYSNAGTLICGDDIIYGGDGNDLLYGDVEVNTGTLTGGNDTIEGGAGGDVMQGGTNTDLGDTLSYASSNLGVTVNLAANTSSGGHATGDTFSGFENATGSIHVDYLTGNSGANRLFGGDSGDSLYGGGGADHLHGDAGADFMYGGLGDDYYYVDNIADFIDEGAAFPSIPGGGNDTLYSIAEWYYESSHSIEILYCQAGSMFTVSTVVGGGNSNSIYGDGGNNNLFANWGDDWINAGAGIDHIDLQGNPDNMLTEIDTVYMAPGSSWDIIWNFTTGVDNVDLSAYDLGDWATFLTLGHGTSGGNAWVALAGGDVLYFVGVTFDQLSEGDFIFV
jgi:Ca2+-binding RTX toxin-like protein